MNNYFVEIKQVADSWALASKAGKGISFPTENKAKEWAKKNVTGHLTTAWRVIDRENAEKHYDV